jgi:drebrin-like protein
MGLFPSNYVELQESSASSVPAVPASTAHDSAPHEDYYPKETEHEEEPEDDGETAIAEYEYDAQEENELSFPEGARITHIQRVDENWWAGTYDGKEGLFPGTRSPLPSCLASNLMCS